MAFGRRTSILVPFERVAQIDGEVVFVRDFVIEVLVFPMYNMGPAKLLEVEMHALRGDVFTVECLGGVGKDGSEGDERDERAPRS